MLIICEKAPQQKVRLASHECCVAKPSEPFRPTNAATCRVSCPLRTQQAPPLRTRLVRRIPLGSSSILRARLRAKMGAGGSLGRSQGKTQDYLENAATALPLLLKQQSASGCRAIADRLGRLKDEAERLARTKEASENASPSRMRPPAKSYEQQSKWDSLGATTLKQAFASCDMIDARWLVSLAKTGGRVPRNQDIPPEAIVNLEEMEAWDDPYSLGALVVSYPWLGGSSHPDPNGEILHKLSLILDAYASKASAIPSCRIGVFWSYCSLPQKHNDGSDDRDEEQMQRFSTALSLLSVLPKYITAGYIQQLGMWTPMLQPDAWLSFPQSELATPVIGSPMPTPTTTPMQLRPGRGRATSQPSDSGSTGLQEMDSESHGTLAAIRMRASQLNRIPA